MFNIEEKKLVRCLMDWTNLSFSTFKMGGDSWKSTFNCAKPGERSQNGRLPVGTFDHLPDPALAKMLLDVHSLCGSWYHTMVPYDG